MCYIGDTGSKNLYQKLAPMHVNKIMRFKCSAVFGSFWYQKRAQNRAAFYSVQVSGISILSVCQPYCPKSITHVFPQLRRRRGSCQLVASEWV